MIAPLFVSHGAPTLLGEDIPARDFLAGLGRNIGRPRAVLAVSAHWETETPRASTADPPATIHDFYGFPRELYTLRYNAPGAPEIARQVVDHLNARDIAAELDPARGLDHGAWVPLMLMYPEADVPVVQLSIQTARGTRHHHAVGQALASLARDDVLILASGSAVHNLGDLAFGHHDDPPAWAKAFDDWLAARIEADDGEALLDYRRQAPHAARAHPREEHLLPLFVALGAVGAQARGRRIHSSFAHGSLSMAAFRFS